MRIEILEELKAFFEHCESESIVVEYKGEFFGLRNHHVYYNKDRDCIFLETDSLLRTLILIDFSEYDSTATDEVILYDNLAKHSYMKMNNVTWDILIPAMTKYRSKRTIKDI